jgi:hypothetical protein
MQQEALAQGGSPQIPNRTIKVIAVNIIKVFANIVLFTFRTLFKSILLCVVFFPVIKAGTLQEVNMPVFCTILVSLIVWDIGSTIARKLTGEYIKLGPTKDLIERRLSAP